MERAYFGARSPPAPAPSSARWCRDRDINNCMQCARAFSPLIRKHHCRRCGGIFCYDCSNQKLLIPRDQILFPPEEGVFALIDMEPTEPQRTCDSCAGVLAPMQESLRQLMSKANQEIFLDRDGAERYMNLPIHFSLDQDIRKATYILYNFSSDNAIEGEDSIPRELLWKAKGIAFMTIIKAGFFFTGRVGTGLVVARLPDGSWSAPTAICCTGLGWGFQLGGEVTDVVIVLNTQGAVDAFASRAQVSLGTELGISLGPVGRTAATDLHAGDKGVSAAFSYAHSKGFFVGVSLEASVLTSRPDVNRAFYGESVQPSQLLSGAYPRPKAAAPLYQAISEIISPTTDSKRDSMQPQRQSHEAPSITKSNFGERDLLGKQREADLFSEPNTMQELKEMQPINMRKDDSAENTFVIESDDSDNERERLQDVTIHG